MQHKHRSYINAEPQPVPTSFTVSELSDLKLTSRSLSFCLLSLFELTHSLDMTPLSYYKYPATTTFCEV